MKTTQVAQRKDGTFQVQMYLCESRDDMIELLWHPACFATEAAAQRLADKIQAAKTFHPENWLWDVSVCSPYSFMHVAPTAFPYRVS